MALFSTDALNPGVRKREVFGWAMYDFDHAGDRCLGRPPWCQ